MGIPVLYILIRNDLDSMNMGKAAAQASHASNAFVQRFHEEAQKNTLNCTSRFSLTHEVFYNWQNTTDQGFGTVLVLEANIEKIREVTSNMYNSGYLAEIVHDPTYPIKDGFVTHRIPLDTCAYVFVEDFDNVTPLKDIPLHR